MKRKVPHIILRFSKHVPAAAAAHTPSESTIPTNSTRPDTTANDMARQSDAATRTSKRNGDTTPLKSSSGRNKKSNNLEPLAQVDRFQPPGSQTTRRKRVNDFSVGGGKGDLPIPPKRARRSAAPEQHAGQAPSQDEKGKKGEDKRVLRSQDPKLTEYAEWLEPEDRDAIDWSAPITLIEGDIPAITFNGDVIAGGSASRTVGDVHRPSEGASDSNVTSPPFATETSVNNLSHPNRTTPVVAIDVSPRTRPIVTIDLEAEARASKNRFPTRYTYDPLSADRYLKPHQGKVREEKRQRNLERERVVFQKAQYEKKLTNLKSEEWMKIFGLAGLVASGIDVDKKALERRRAAMIKDLEAMLIRYNTCKEEERRRRVAKGGRASASPVNSMDVETRKSSTEDYEVPLDDEDEEDEQGIEASAGGTAGDEVGHQPNNVKKRRQKPKLSKPKKVLAVLPEPEPKPFTSFYNNTHDRKAAVSGRRRAGRNQSAFGQPLPEPESQEFKLPDEILNAAARHTRARRRVSR
ncbi:hypothetical protein C7212DRAFT_365888 [Tuber magnatum]|uniref:Something about silencing protein 4 domain-containing protein n=1 Tax=Tuber magnatum TaxID=42249 RepID=A0A317SFW2_9PEZI|nr:hypothetical protein C7212DRAFT_365888 [Tuber magnatum]